jgi:hypothetical protein
LAAGAQPKAAGVQLKAHGLCEWWRWWCAAGQEAAECGVGGGPGSAEEVAACNIFRGRQCTRPRAFVNDPLPSARKSNSLPAGHGGVEEGASRGIVTRLLADSCAARRGSQPVCNPPCGQPVNNPWLLAPPALLTCFQGFGPGFHHESVGQPVAETRRLKVMGIAYSAAQRVSHAPSPALGPRVSLVLPKLASHSRVVDRHTRNSVHSLGLECCRVRDEAWRVLDTAGWSEGAWDCKNDHLQAASAPGAQRPRS